MGLAAPSGAAKIGLRHALRAGPGGEPAWQRLQAFAYGEGMVYARPFPGVERFVTEALRAGIEVTIVSHKSRFAAARPDVDLRAAASEWLGRHAQLGQLPVAFADSRAEKLALIARASVDVFIDDLVEVFDDPGFPPNVQRWLFAPHGADAATNVDRVVRRWEELCDDLAAR